MEDKFIFENILKYDKIKSIKLEIVNSITDFIMGEYELIIYDISMNSEKNRTMIDFIVPPDIYFKIMEYISKTKYIIDTEYQGINTEYEYKITECNGIKFNLPGVFCLINSGEFNNYDNTIQEFYKNYEINEKWFYIECVYTNGVELIDEIKIGNNY